MAKQVNMNTPLYHFISDFHSLWKSNSNNKKDDMPFLSISNALKELQEDIYAPKDKKNYSIALVKEFDNLLFDYFSYIENSIPEDMMHFIEELDIKTESSSKNFRAQWVVGWIKSRKNFDAAYTMAVITSLYRFHADFLEHMIENDCSFVRLQNSEKVIHHTVELLYKYLPENIITENFKNTVYSDEECFFKIFFYGLLYIISCSDTDNSLYNNNEQYFFTDIFRDVIRNMEKDFPGKLSANFNGYYTALFNHTRVLRLRKHDKSSKKKIENTFVTPALENEYGSAKIKKGKVNVIMGISGLGKSSVLYALSCAALFDKTDSEISESEKFHKLRKELQQLTTLPLDKTVPVYFYATDYRNKNGIYYPSVNQFAYGVQGITEDGSDLERLLNIHNGHIMFLVDAIDEMAPELRAGFMIYLRQIKEKYPSSTFVITTRNIKQQIFDDLTTEVELLKIAHSDENIRKMIANYIKLFEKDRYTAEDFYNKLYGNHYLKNILQNPYQIQKIISSTDYIKALHPVYVYDNLIRNIVEDKWDGLFEGLNSSNVVDVLRVLACRMNKGSGKKMIPARELAATLAECAEEAGIHGGIEWNNFSDSIAIRSGLLLYDDIENGFTFMSGEFIDYLTAQWVYRQFSNKRRTFEKIQSATGISLNKHIFKGILSQCLKENMPTREGLIMLFYYANYKEDGGLSGNADTVRLLMEMMLEDALIYGDKEKISQLAVLLKEEIPKSDMGIIDLESKPVYSAVEKL